MANPHPKYKAKESTVPMRVPARLKRTLEQDVIPWLLAQECGGVVDDVVLCNLTKLKHYKLRHRNVVHLQDIRSQQGFVVFCGSRVEDNPQDLGEITYEEDGE